MYQEIFYTHQNFLVQQRLPIQISWYTGILVENNSVPERADLHFGERPQVSTLCPERMTSGDARFFQTQRKGISFVCGTNPHQLTRCQGEIAEWRAELKRIDLGVQKQTIKKGKYQSDINERVIERLS